MCKYVLPFVCVGTYVLRKPRTEIPLSLLMVPVSLMARYRFRCSDYRP